MTEKKKARFLLRGMKQELFTLLMRKPPKIVHKFLSEATAIEKTLEMRTRQYNRRLIPDSAAVQAFRSPDQRKTLRSTMREQLPKLSPFPLPDVMSINEAMRE